MPNLRNNQSNRIEAVSGPKGHERLVIESKLNLLQARNWMLKKFNVTTSLECRSWKETRKFNSEKISTGTHNGLEWLTIGYVKFLILCEN